MIVAVVVAQLLLVAAPAAPPWCAEATRRVESARGTVVSPATVEAVLAALPPVIAERARGDIGREARLQAAVDSADTAVRTACRVVDVDGDAAAQVQVLLRDGRFGGLRTEDDFSDKVLERVWKWIEALFESEGMQLFADNTRVIYLSVLAVVVVVTALRLLRRSRRSAQGLAGGATNRVERQRLKAFAAWRAEALALIDDDAQLRRVLLLLRAALLARVGEQDQDAVVPSRTSQEILARLGARAVVVAPALQRFDAAFYGGGTDRPAARALLVDVDAAAAALLKQVPT